MPSVVKKRPRFCLELNSHSLSYFQRCEELYRFKQIKCLEHKDEPYPFKRGAKISKILQLWYMARQKSFSPAKLDALEWHLVTKAKKSQSFVDSKWGDDDRVHIATRLMGYFNKYRTEKYKIIAVEKGFTKTIYEDSNVLFVYSGKPDVVMDFGAPFYTGPMDHKSEGRKNDLYEFNNQMLGYCWSTNAHFGMYNYIGLQKDAKDGDVFRREPFIFTKGQIEQWKNDTIGWFFRAMQAQVNRRFLRSWNCQGQYGVCEMHTICEAPTASSKLIKIKQDFNILPEPYKSW